jgi:hyperosmotically inducible protein
MKLQKASKLAVACTLVIAATFAVAAYTQESGSGPQSVPASESFRQAGEQTEQAAHSGYQGAKTALNDTRITLKVKAALDRDRVTGASAGNIHVTTTAGIVTLKGTVPTAETLAQAELLARSTQGARNVMNELQIASATD